MESLRVVLLDLEKSVQCVICLGSLKTPVTTRCNHNFCDECIRKALKNKSEIPCPLCKKVVRLRSLKKATHLQNLVSAVHKVTNRVQECADIPYTLSQSTREEEAISVVDANHVKNKLLPLGSVVDGNSNLNCNGKASARGTDTKLVNNKTDNSTQINGKEKTDSGTGNTVTVTVDVHHSPMDSQITVSGNNTEIHSLATGTTELSNSIQQLPTIKLNSHSNATNGSVITSDANDNSVLCEVIKDPFAFPMSQNSKTEGETRKKREVRSGRKKIENYALTKKRKSTSSEEMRSTKKKQKKSLKDSGETDVSELTTSVRTGKVEEAAQKKYKKNVGNDNAEASDALKMIKDVENHKLTVEKVQVSKSPVKQVNRKSMTGEQKSPTEKQSLASSVRAENVKIKSPHLVRRLLSVSSSSSESEMEQATTRTVLPHEPSSQQTVNDKVSDWLETTTATTTYSSVHSSPSAQCERKQTETLTSDDDLLSHSQVSIEHIPDRVLIIKRRKISPAKFDPRIQRSVQNRLWNREKEVFGTQKSKNTFLSKNRKNLSCLWPSERSTSSEDGQLINKSSKVTSGKKSLKKQSRSEQTIYIERKERKTVKNTLDKLSSNEESIYNVQGLSQNVSPFNTPTKNQDPKSPEKAYVLVTPIQSNITTIKSPSNNDLLKESVKKITSNQPLENYNIEDDNELESVNEDGFNTEQVDEEFSDGFLAKVTEEGALKASNAVHDIVVDDLQKINSSSHDHVTTVQESANENASGISKKDETKGSSEKENPMKVPAPPTIPSSKQGRNMKQTPNRISTRSSLPLVGDSPTTQSSVKSVEMPVPVSSVPEVELGLLDFSEVMVLPPKTEKKIPVERPEVVAETCRMVLQSFDEMKAMNLDIEDTTEQEIGRQTKQTSLKNTKLSNEKHASEYETDDSAIPPSTSTAETAVPATPPPCHLTRATYQSIETTADESDLKEDAVLNDGKTIEEGIVEHDLIVDTHYDSRILVQNELSKGDASDMDNNKDQGNMQCLSNGWGGTKLRIFKSASSAEFSDSISESSFSLRKQKKTMLKKGASGSKVFIPDADSNILSKSTQQNSAIVALRDDILEAEALTDSLLKTGDEVVTQSVDIIPNSDKITETNSASGTLALGSLRKSTRKNKGRNSFDFVSTAASHTTKKDKMPNQVTDTTDEKLNSKLSHMDKSDSRSKNPEVNPVLKHIEAAIAHADTSYINWADDGTSNENFVTSSSQGKRKKLPSQSHSGASPTKQKQAKAKEKLKKTQSPKKLPDSHQRRVPMGKRTKKSKMVLDNRKTSSADELKIQQSDHTSDDDFNRSWPYEIRKQETFSCSLPNAVPKHITDVSVRLKRISQTQPAELHRDEDTSVEKPSKDKEANLVKISEEKVDFSDDLIEASPMMFETQQENEIGRSSKEKNTHGRSVNIDLREVNESEARTLDEVDFIHDDIDYVEGNEADDVICCSWNEEVDNQVGARSASCHEETSSINSSERQISQETKLHNFNINEKDAKIYMQQKTEEKICVTDEYYKTATFALNSMCNLDGKLLFENFPQSCSILRDAIELCFKAKLSLDSEFSMQNLVKQTEGTKVGVEPNSAKAEMKRRRGHPSKKRLPSSAPVTKLSQNQISKTKSSLRIAKKKTDTNEEPVPAINEKSDTGIAEATKEPNITAEEKTTDVDQEWKFDDDDMAMFDEIDDVLEFGARALDGDLTKGLKGTRSKNDKPSTSKKMNGSNVAQDYLSASLEEAMLETEIETSELPEKARTSQLKKSEIVEERMEMDVAELDYMDETVGQTQESLEKNDIIPSSPNAEESEVADKVNKWLRRLSDLNKKEGDEQKRKIGDKWTRTSDENSSISSNDPAELLKKLDHEAVKARANLSKKSDNGSATSDSITKFMNELEQESVKSDNNANSKVITGEMQQRRLSSEEGELQRWIDSSTKNTDRNSLNMIPVSAKDIGNGNGQPVTSSVPESQSRKSLQFATSSSHGRRKQPLQVVSQSETVGNDDNNQITGQNQGLDIEKLSQGSSKYSNNMFNTKVVLRKLDLLTHDDVISASPPYPDSSYISRVDPKVERWLEASQPEAASPPTIESPIKEKLGFMSSGLQEKGVHLVKMFANKHNGQFYSRFDKDNVTHIIVRATEQRSCDRTLKYLQGIAAKKWIVSVKWVSDCLEQDTKLPEENFEIMGDNCMKEFESDGYEIPQGPMRSRTSPDDFKLLRNYRCVCLPPFSLITTEQAMELLETCGATVAKHLGDLITDSNDKSLPERQRIIIIDVEIASDPPDYIAMGNQFGATVVSLEWMYESISRFEVQPPSEYTITGFTQDSDVSPNGD